MSNTVIWLLPMEFVKRLTALRKQRGLTQQALADDIELHVNQIKRYEAGTAQPTLETLVRLAKALHTTLDNLVFGEDSRTPLDELKLQFEALSQFNDEERKVAKEVLESLILKHNANALLLINFKGEANAASYSALVEYL
ncbi:helix-turn-helix transcriptional regulator [Pseudoalteromonas piscicida]|uniref:helix-turn-helix domain-containing protein n=1 Tax=Pseudoalteromonas piscicida TaxID=43662 RepID=UPI001EFED955|nr:helix-turn-helix transcriptional regulator [Pseudoalteromonas piscicida]MCG9768452.1 helix-turn-helix transcriptional regulator [Pseudoalteromonas piscicida]